MDLIDIFRTFHPTAEEYTFSSAHGIFSKIDHIMGHKSNLSKFKKMEIMSSIFPDHNTMRLDINYKKKTVRNTNTWRLNNTFPNNQQATEEIKREIKKFLVTNDNENMTTVNIYAPRIGAPQYIRLTLTDIKGEIDSNTIIVEFNTTLTPMDRSSK